MKHLLILLGLCAQLSAMAQKQSPDRVIASYSLDRAPQLTITAGAQAQIRIIHVNMEGQQVQVPVYNLSWTVTGADANKGTVTAGSFYSSTYQAPMKTPGSQPTIIAKFDAALDVTNPREGTTTVMLQCPVRVLAVNAKKSK